MPVILTGFLEHSCQDKGHGTVNELLDLAQYEIQGRTQEKQNSQGASPRAYSRQPVIYR